VKNPEDFAQTLDTLRVGPKDILVSVDVISLFTRLPLNNALDLLTRHFDENILKLFRHVLTSSFFSFNVQFYEQTDRVAHGIAPVPCDCQLFHGKLRRRGTKEGNPQTTLLVDNTFVIWPHGRENLDDFHHLLNSVQNNIQFTVETETDGHFPFLGIDFYSKPDGSLGHRMYRKPTHTNL
jgi:hypothetical protein